VCRATICSELNLLRTIINWGSAETRGYCAKVKVFVPRRAKARPNQLDPEDFVRGFRAAVEPHVQFFLLIAICTTQRMSAILDLTWDRVDFEKRTINFRIDRDQDDILDSSGQKGRSKVDMNPLLFRVLMEQRRFAKTSTSSNTTASRSRASAARSILRSRMQGSKENSLARMRSATRARRGLPMPARTCAKSSGLRVTRTSRRPSWSTPITATAICAVVDFLDDAISPGVALNLHNRPRLKLIKDDGDAAR
jgi:integrase